MGHHSKKEHHEEFKHTKKRAKGGYKIFTVVTFFILAVYLAGYLISFATRPSVRVESVEMGSIMLPATIEGLIIREESVVTSTRSGTPRYFYTDNEKVAKNKVICSVEDSAKVEKIEAEIDTIDRSIIDIQKNRSDISVFSSDIKNIEKQIDTVFDDHTYKFLSGDISGVYDMKERAVSYMDARTNIWVAESSQSLSELQSQRLNYEAQLGENKSYITNAQSGIVCYRTDGFESEFTPENMASITKENFKMSYDVSYIRHSSDVKEGDPLFKIVSSNTWYIAAFIDENESVDWKKGDTKELYTTVNEEEKTIIAEIYSISPKEGENFVIFVTDKDITDFISERELTFKINEDKYEGFKIPNEAIVEKSFIKLPIECVIESVGETSVIKKDNEGDKLVNISVTGYDEGFAYVNQSTDGIKLGDTILKGTGMEAQSYTVSELVVYKGVYVANSSMAQFKMIDIIGQNAEYTIVDSESGYGLRIYDKIVADAAFVEESQALY